MSRPEPTSSSVSAWARSVGHIRYAKAEYCTGNATPPGVNLAGLAVC